MAARRCHLDVHSNEPLAFLIVLAQLHNPVIKHIKPMVHQIVNTKRSHIGGCVYDKSNRENSSGLPDYEDITSVSSTPAILSRPFQPFPTCPPFPMYM